MKPSICSSKILQHVPPHTGAAGSATPQRCCAFPWPWAPSCRVPALWEGPAPPRLGAQPRPPLRERLGQGSIAPPSHRSEHRPGPAATPLPRGGKNSGARPGGRSGCSWPAERRSGSGRRRRARPGRSAAPGPLPYSRHSRRSPPLPAAAPGDAAHSARGA